MLPRQTARLFSPDIPFSPFPDAGTVGVTDATRDSYRDGLDIKLSVELTSRLADGILFAHDKTAMTHSLEVRMPFLDLDVVQFAHRLPSRFKVQGKQMKIVLASLAKELPADVAKRQKQGLNVPHRIYRSEMLRHFYAETILETSLSTGLFNHRRLEAWVGKRAVSSHLRSLELWPLYHFCLRWNNFMETDLLEIDTDTAAAARF